MKLKLKIVFVLALFLAGCGATPLAKETSTTTGATQSQPSSGWWQPTGNCYQVSNLLGTTLISEVPIVVSALGGLPYLPVGTEVHLHNGYDASSDLQVISYPVPGSTMNEYVYISIKTADIEPCEGE